MKYLLDTNIISESVKDKPYVPVTDFISKINANDLYLSVLSIGEIRKGIAKLNDKAIRKQTLVMWLENDLTQFFGNRIIPITVEVANKWGFILSNLKNPAPVIDSLIAATAITYNLTLVTRNIKDYTNFPVELLNPWDC